MGEGFDEMSARFDEKRKENRRTHQSKPDSGDDAKLRSYQQSRAVAYERWLEKRIDYDENKWTDFSQYGRKALMEKMHALEKEGHTKLLEKKIDGNDWFDDDQQTFHDFDDKSDVIFERSRGDTRQNGRMT